MHLLLQLANRAKVRSFGEGVRIAVARPEFNGQQFDIGQNMS